MLRRALVLAMLMLLTVPSFASAYNYWSITMSVSPALSDAVTPPSGPGYVRSGNVINVGGSKDVAFDKQNPFVYQTYGGDTAMSLANASYDAATKTCSNVSCHRQETVVKWGTPYRWYTNECDRCHSYSY